MGDKMSDKNSPLEEMKSESAQQAKDPKTRALLAALLALWLVTLAALVGVGWYALATQVQEPAPSPEANMDIVDLWRGFNAILAFVAACYVLCDLKSRYYHLSERRLYLKFALTGLLFSTSIASIEAIVQDNPLGYRIALFSACSIWTLIGLHLSRNDKT